MFPLGSVLLPSAILPLHIFEPRYVALVHDCLNDDIHEFGVVLIERGSEVGGGEVRRDVGVVARLRQVSEAGPGRYGVVAIGTRRIRINAWLPDDPYPVADVDDWHDDEEDVPAELIDDVRDRTRRANFWAVQLGDLHVAPDDTVNVDPLVASYQLVIISPLGPHDQYTLLCCSGPASRLTRLAEMLDDLLVIQQLRINDEELNPPRA